MLKRIIFDLDDTLIPWKSEYWHSFIPIMKKFRVIDSEEDMLKLSAAIDSYENEYKCYDEKDFIEYVNRKLGKKISLSFFEQLKLLFTTCIPNMIDVQLVDTLEYLSTKYELVVLTNFFEELQRKRLENYGIIKYFKNVYGGDKFIKPNKESYWLACDNHKPNECMMIGDNLINDVMGAKENGLQAIYLNNKQIKVDKNIISINNLIELKDIL